jgi:hypothetical protein
MERRAPVRAAASVDERSAKRMRRRAAKRNDKNDQ